MSVFDIADLFTGFFEAFCTFLLFESFLEHRRAIKPWIYYVVAVALGVMINFSNHLYTTNTIINMGIMIISNICFSMIYRSTVKLKLILSLFSYMVSLGCEIIVYMFMSAFTSSDTSEITGDGFLNLIGIAASKIGECALILMIVKAKKNNKNQLDSGYWILFLLTLISVIITLYMLYMVIESGVPKNIRINIYICTICTILTSIIILFLHAKNTKQHSQLADERLISRSLNEQVKHYSDVLKSYDTLRSFKHDINNMLIAVRAKAVCGEINGCIDLLDNMIGITNVSPVYNTGNTVLDAMLSAKKEEAIQKNINFKTNIKIPPNALPLEDKDISIIFGNALDNAIEACERLDTKRYIFILIKHDGKKVSCRIENSCPDNTFITHKTSKSDKYNHGIGIRNMERTLDKYSAVYDTQISDGAYILSILFGNSEHFDK